ncbi:MAG TPA: hypothetical protein VGQ41_13535 [Pyrinomonadaceae bacterium]|jgi:hypothetical protein|nr:hypothetical protein [Pyrinomonadaceae bacterium]
MSEQINQSRRRFIANTAMTFAAADLGMIGLAKARPKQTSKPNLGPLKQINAGVLNVGYVEVASATICHRKHHGRLRMLS